MKLLQETKAELADKSKKQFHLQETQLAVEDLAVEEVAALTSVNAAMSRRLQQLPMYQQPQQRYQQTQQQMYRSSSSSSSSRSKYDADKERRHEKKQKRLDAGTAGPANGAADNNRELASLHCAS